MNDQRPEEKYTLLFTLPKSLTTLLIFYGILLYLTSFLGYITHFFNLKTMSIFFFLNLTQLFVIKYMGSKTVPYASLRRITFAEIMAQIPVLLFFIVEFFFYKPLLLFLILGLVTSYRLIVYYGAFFEQIKLAFITSIIPIIPFLFFGDLFGLFLLFLIPTISLVLVFKLDKISIEIINEKTTTLFKYFMSAWVSEYPFFLEKFLEINSVKSKIKVFSILLNGSKQVRIIIPFAHPGPFKPIGSFNLPYEIKKQFIEDVVVFHAPVDHEFNIPSHIQLYHFLDRIKKEQKKKSSGNIISKPLQLRSKNFEIIIFGILNYYLIIINPITPCEDFPSEFLNLFKRDNFIVIDAHNNLGSKPDESKMKEIVEVINSLNLNLQWDKDVLVGHSHIDYRNSEDIGPGGIDCITFYWKNTRDYFSFIVFDSNNVKAGLTEKLISELKGEFGNLIILTTDSHFNAAKISTEKGYKALGEETHYNTLLYLCKRLLHSARKNLESKEIELIENEIETKIMGRETLSKINKLLDKSLKFFKQMWILLLSITFIFSFIIVLVNI